MKKSIFLLSVCLLSFAGLAYADAMTAEQYSAKFHITNGDEGDQEVIKSCLASWPKHPFKKKDNSYFFREMKTAVKVAGVGKSVRDTVETDYPQLILIQPSVSVMTKNSYELLNPNGWYCFKTAVTVLGKGHIQAHCKAHLASYKEGAAIAGSKNDQVNGVVVLGKIHVELVGCPDSKKAD